MTKSFEESDLKSEVSQLLTAVVLGDASDEQIDRLNELLLSDELLRHHTAQFLEEEALLRHEFKVLDRVVEFHNPLPGDRRDEITPSSTSQPVCESRFQRSRRQLLFLATSVLIAALAGTIWLELKARKPASNETANAGENSESARSHRSVPFAAGMLSPVTYVSWSGPRFASELDARPLAAKMQEGVVPFTSAFGRPAKGYMVCLQPGSLLDLAVAADSEGENALAVIEFDRAGRPTGRRLSFSNNAGRTQLRRDGSGRIVTLTKKGRLGIWTERNDSAEPRYYFFTAVHKLLKRAADDSWHVSRLSVFVDEPYLVHIGWDDSGMLSTGENDRVHVPDDDFDDVSATIRIRNSNSKPDEREPAVNFYTKTTPYEAETESPGPESRKHVFAVDPGRVAILKVCSRSNAAVDVAVLEKESGKLRWHCRKEESSSPTLGICAIENNTRQPQEFYLVAQVKAVEGDQDASSRRMSPTVLFDEEELVTVGFDNVKKLSDFYRLKADILTMGDL